MSYDKCRRKGGDNKREEGLEVNLCLVLPSPMALFNRQSRAGE